MSASTSANSVPLPRPKAPRVKKGSQKPSSSTPPLGKFLASSEKPIRDKAVASLARFLAGAKQVEGVEEVLEVGELNWDEETSVDARLAPGEMAKLWKGIFFCFWMSDKPLVQQALANDIALLTLAVRPKKGPERPLGRVARFRSAMCYLRGFWEAVVREWEGLDRLRLDKFYLLIRRFVHAAFLLLAREEWDPRAIAEYNLLLTGPGGPLHVLDHHIPHSLCYHLADIYLTELNRALLPSSPTLPPTAPLLLLLAPFLHTLALAPSAPIFVRISTNVFTPLFEATLEKKEPRNKKRKVELVVEAYEGIVGGCVEGVEGGEGLGRKVLQAVFEEGGKTGTNEVNRRKMYLIYREWGDDEE